MKLKKNLGGLEMVVKVLTLVEKFEKGEAKAFFLFGVKLNELSNTIYMILDNKGIIKKSAILHIVKNELGIKCPNRYIPQRLINDIEKTYDWYIKKEVWYGIWEDFRIHNNNIEKSYIETIEENIKELKKVEDWVVFYTINEIPEVEIYVIPLFHKYKHELDDYIGFIERKHSKFYNSYRDEIESDIRYKPYISIIWKVEPNYHLLCDKFVDDEFTIEEMDYNYIIPKINIEKVETIKSRHFSLTPVETATEELNKYKVNGYFGGYIKKWYKTFDGIWVKEKVVVCNKKKIQELKNKCKNEKIEE